MYNTWKIQDGKLIYSCGCKFDIVKEREGQFPLIKPGNPYKNWNYQCEATKMLLGDGNTAGVFQLESFLGKHWAKRLKPESVEHMSALTAILRPGVLEARSDKGISVTEMYCRYKNNEEVATPLVPEIGYLLKDTYYQMLYQEDAMNIARDIAGFTPAQCDNLRKGISKKLGDVIAKIKDDFIEGCKKTGKVSEEKARLIFDSIEKSQRYSFNHCLSPDTLVEKINGELVSIKDISIGEIIKSTNGKTKVINKYENGKKEIVRIKLESGKSIECTLNHKFMCEDQQIRELWEIIEKSYKIVTREE